MAVDLSNGWNERAHLARTRAGGGVWPRGTVVIPYLGLFDFDVDMLVSIGFGIAKVFTCNAADLMNV